MRALAVALLVLVAAVLGAVAALGLARTTGWVRGSGTKTVVIRTPPAGTLAAPAAVRSSAKPLPGNGFDPQLLYAQRSAGVVTIYAYFNASGSTVQAAQGSGFVVSPTGYVLTNSHVITDAGAGSTPGTAHAADKVYVEFNDRDRIPATVVGWDLFDDVGVLKVDPKDHPLDPVPLGDSDAVAVGEPVAAIGSPLGNEDSLSVGVVSAHRAIGSLTSQYDVIDAIQTDAAITHGNSGGPLFDARGRVIGINAQIRADSSGNDTGIGFAVPIDSAKRSMRQLVARGHVSYAFVGIETTDLTPSIAHRFHLGADHGALITDVHSGTPAERAGLRAPTGQASFEGSSVPTGGDAIVAIDGRPVNAADDVVRIVANLTPGQLASFTVVHGKQRRVATVRLAERPATP